MAKLLCQRCVFAGKDALTSGCAQPFHFFFFLLPFSPKGICLNLVQQQKTGP
jgi:hypothetical protein